MILIKVCTDDESSSNGCGMRGYEKENICPDLLSNNILNGVNHAEFDSAVNDYGDGNVKLQFLSFYTFCFGFNNQLNLLNLFIFC